MQGERFCISCGMPLRSAEDYPLRDTSKDYCRHCAREDGTLKSFEEALEGMSVFLQRTQGLTREIARKTAFSFLIKNPAWKDYAK